MDDAERFHQLTEQLAAHPGYVFLNRMKMFDVSLNILRGNYSELRRVLQFLAESEEAHEVLRITNRHKLDTVLCETLRLLHNFVAAANSLIDHTRVLYRDFDEAGKGFVDYQQKVDSLFAGKGLPDFIKGLRHYCLHYKVPGIGIQVEVTDAGSQEHRRVFIHKSDLLEFSKWTPAARAFIDEQGERLDVLARVDDYQKMIIEFQNWFRKRLAETHEAEFKEADKLQREYGCILAKGQVRIFLNNKDAYESVEDSLYHILNSDQIGHLKSIGSIAERRDELLRMLRKAVDLDDELEAQIKQAYDL